MVAYLFVIKLRFMAGLQFRFVVISSAVSNLIVLFAAYYLWKVAFKGTGAVASVTENQMISYATVSVLMSSIFVTGVQNTIYSRMMEGSIAIDFMRPLNPLFFFLSEDFGTAISAILNKALPILLISGPLFLHSFVIGKISFFLFSISCFLSYLILWLLSALVGVLSFWTTDLGNFGSAKDAIVRVLSGSIVPTWFFPSWFEKISTYLPFRYTYQAPLEIFIGRVQAHFALHLIMIQLAWVLILSLIVTLAWEGGRKKIMVNGG